MAAEKTMRMITTIAVLLIFIINSSYAVRTQTWIENSYDSFKDGYFYRTTYTVDGIKIRQWDDWYDPAWSRRKIITIDNRDKSLLVDYQLELKVNTYELISNNKMRADGADIRITDEDGKTLLPIWIDTTTLNTTQTVIWVKVPRIEPTIKRIYMYYYNLSTTTIVSNRDAVFDLYEDWESGVIDPQKGWQISGSPDCSICYFETTTDTPHGIYKGRYAVQSAEKRPGSSRDNKYSSIRISVRVTMDAQVSFAWATSSEPTWDKLLFIVDGAEKSWIAGINPWSIYAYYPLSAGEHVLEWRYTKDAGGDAGTEDQAYLDEIIVRKYTPSPPAVTVTSAAEDDTYSQYFREGLYWSNVYDTGSENTKIDLVSYTVITPPATSVSFEYRLSNSSFSILSDQPPNWISLPTNNYTPSQRGRYIQYRAKLAGGGSNTPTFKEMYIAYRCPPPTPTNFKGVVISTSQILWTWEDNASGELLGETTYFVYNATTSLRIASLPPDTTKWLEENIPPNTYCSRYCGAANEVGENYSNTFSLYTLSLPPDVFCSNKSTGVWYTDPIFKFVNRLGGFGQGYIEYYAYMWTQQSTYTFTGMEPKWSSGELSLRATLNGSWYLHLESRNGDNVGNGQLTLGPFYFNGSPSTITDLVVKPGRGKEGAVVLSWTAPYSDATFGNLVGGKYRIRWTTDKEFNNDNFENLGYEYVISTSVVQGVEQSIVITGLIPGVSYYFAIKTEDSEGNKSYISNVVYRCSSKVQRIVFVTPTETFPVTGRSSKIIVEVRGEYDEPIRIAEDTILTLQVTPSSQGEFSTFNEPPPGDPSQWGATQVRIPKDETQVWFYYKDKVAGIQTVIVDETPDKGWHFAAQQYTIIPGEAKYFTVEHDGEGIVFSREKITIKARDEYNNVAVSYRGTVNFVSSSPDTILYPSSYTFTSVDSGCVVIEALHTKAESIRITAYDVNYSTLTTPAEATRDLVWHGLVFEPQDVNDYPPDFVEQAKGNYVGIKFTMRTTKDESRWSKLIVTLGGSAVNTDISNVRLYLDNPSYGTPGKFDPQDWGLASASFDLSMTAVLDFPHAAQPLSPTPKVYFLVFDVAPEIRGATAKFRIESPASFGNISGIPMAANNIPYETKEFSLEKTGILVKVSGEDKAKEKLRVIQGEEDVCMLKLRLRTTVQAAVRWMGLRVDRTGLSVDSDIMGIKIYRDANNNGEFERYIDKKIAEKRKYGNVYPFKEGYTIVDIPDEEITTTEKTYFLVLDISPTAEENHTVGVELKYATVEYSRKPRNVPSKSYFIFNGLNDAESSPDFSTDKSIKSSECKIAATVDTVIIDPEPQAMAEILQGEKKAFVRFRLRTDPQRSEAKEMAAAVFTEIKLKRIGESKDDDVAAVMLYKDNGDRIFVEGQDELISSGEDRFSKGVASIKLTKLQTITTTYSDYFFIVLKIFEEATPNVYVGVECKPADGGVIFKSPDIIANDALSFSARTIIREYPDKVTIISTSTIPSRIDPGEKNVVVSKLSIFTELATARWYGVLLSRVGNGKYSDIEKVKIYKDDGDYVFNPSSDTLIGYSVFNATDEAKITFAAPEILRPTTQTYYIVYDFFENIEADKTHGVLYSNSDFTISAPDYIFPPFVFSSDLGRINPIKVYAEFYDNPTNLKELRQADTDKVLTLLTLHTSVSSVSLTGIAIERYGTCADTDVAKIEIYYDSDNNGIFDKTKDLKIQSSVSQFVNKVATITFTNPRLLSKQKQSFFILISIRRDAAPDTLMGIKVSTATSILTAQLGITRIEVQPQNFPYVSTEYTIVFWNRPTIPEIIGKSFHNNPSEYTFTWYSLAPAGISERRYGFGRGAGLKDNDKYVIISTQPWGNEDFSKIGVKEVSTEETLEPDGRKKIIVTVKWENLNLQHNVTYFFIVEVKSKDGYVCLRAGEFCVMIDTSPPPPPRNLWTNITEGGNSFTDTFWVNWAPVEDPESGVEAYELQERVDVSQSWQTVDDNISPKEVSYRLTGRLPGKFYYYRLRARNRAGSWSEFSPALRVILEKPVSLITEQSVFPNPVRLKEHGSINIAYNLSANATVKITIYDIFGRVVRRIECNPGGNGGKFGENYVSWDGKNEQGEKVSTGMYICVIEGTNGGSNERKIVKIGVIR
jgi:hypothetical protein